MSFLKIGNRLINSNAIALVKLDEPCDETYGTCHQLTLVGGQELCVTDDLEVRLLRSYFTSPDHVDDLVARDEIDQLSQLLHEVRDRIVAHKQAVPPLVALACIHIHDAIGALKAPDLKNNADLLSDSARELLNFLDNESYTLGQDQHRLPH